MEIRDLIRRLETEHDRFTKVSYNETQLRTDFLDPFFTMLGWDITNMQGVKKDRKSGRCDLSRRNFKFV